MAESNIFYDIEILSLTNTPQNPLHLLAEAAFISENTDDSSKLTKHEISSNYSKCSTNCSEIFTETASHCSTSFTDLDHNEDIELDSSEKRNIKTEHHPNIKPNPQIENLNDGCLNSDLTLCNNSTTISDLTLNSENLISSDDSFSTDTKNSGNLNLNKQDSYKVKSLVDLKYDKERLPPIFEHKSLVEKNQDVKNQIPLSSNDNSNDDVKNPVNPVQLFNKDNSKDNNSKEKLTKKRKRVKSHDDNTERRKKRTIRNRESLLVHSKTYVTRSNRISKPPSASSGGRWTSS
ncbi:hypothetical protein C1645_789308 [Glomus cerebriforme]|uniref:Uncharacterized protein n=1 Tax=Glomus cerebriforme TaxID=658196 RepID=A0A397S8X2_9GLOM|nr:hypothetical protein C1645_789308 [Glomus cerebriforme]